MARDRAIGVKTIVKKEIFLIMAVICLWVAFISRPVMAAQAYNRTTAILLMNADTGEVLYAEHADDRMEIASTTKILTAITVIENNDILRVIEIPTQAVGVEGSSIYLRAGEKWRMLDLLYGLMLRSGNDAAVALALTTAKSMNEFCVMMNDTARRAGATNSHFTNPHGLHDEGHYSTARDMAKITAYAMKNPVFAEICKTKTHVCRIEGADDRKQQVLVNKNKLLYSYEYATGVKTGYTKHSGRCLVSAAKKDGVSLICVTLNVYDTYGVSKGLFEKYFQILASDPQEENA